MILCLKKSERKIERDKGVETKGRGKEGREEGMEKKRKEEGMEMVRQDKRRKGKVGAGMQGEREGQQEKGGVLRCENDP